MEGEQSQLGDFLSTVAVFSYIYSWFLCEISRAIYRILWVANSFFVETTCRGTGDGSEIPNNHLGCKKPCK